MADRDHEEGDGEPQVLGMDQDAVLPQEDEYPYPTSFEELVVTPDHLDWSARIVYMLNQRQHLTWDGCHLCGMFCVSRWCDLQDHKVNLCQQ
eukprot:3946646-Amphidinium_carterae.3